METVYDGQSFDPEVMAVERMGWDQVWECSNGYNRLCDECRRAFVLEGRLGWQGAGGGAEENA